MKKLFYIILPALFTIGFISCDEHDIIPWEAGDMAAIRMGTYFSEYMTVEEYTYPSFDCRTKGRAPYDTIYTIEVNIVGIPVDYDRPIPYRLWEDWVPRPTDNPIYTPGKEVVGFDDPEVVELAVIPAGSTKGYIPIKYQVVHDEDAMIKVGYFAIELYESEYFKVIWTNRRATVSIMQVNYM